MEKQLTLFSRLATLWLMGYLASGCIGQYQAAHRSFNQGNEYYQKGRITKTLREYNRVLDTINTYPTHPAADLLRAILYHRFYLINLPRLWEHNTISFRNKYPSLNELVKTYPTPDKFLTDAFRQVIALGRKSESDYAAHTEKWLLIEKNIIIGDYLVYLGNQTGEFLPDSAGSTEFLQQIRHYTFYETAQNFYVAAWLEMMLTMNNNVGINLEAVWDISWRRVKQTCNELHLVSTLLSLSGRANEFTGIFLGKARYYAGVIRQLETWQRIPAKGEANRELLSAEKILKETGIILLPEYLSLDGEYHLKEARTRMSLVIEATLSHKYALSYQYLLEGLQHTILAQAIGWQDALGNQQLLENISRDIYFQLGHLSK